MESYVDAAVVAKHLNLSEYTVRVYAKNHTIPASKIGGRWRFRISDIDAHLNRPVDTWTQSAQSKGRRRA